MRLVSAAINTVFVPTPHARDVQDMHQLARRPRLSN
jgi:hypothetical protein